MPDKAHEQTDKELKRLERQITKEYSQAAKEVEKKLTDYLEKFAKKDAEMQKKVASGQMSAEEYGKWRVGQMAMGERWKEMQKTLTEDLVNADKIAAGMINDSLPSVYALNYNYGTYEVEHGAQINTSFTLYDHSTVENLMKKDPKIIPKAKVDIPKDELWNRRKLTSAVTQGILQGEDIRKISGRLREAVGGSFYTEKDIKNAYKKTAEQISKELERRNRNAAIRNARTYTTAAENKGRIDSYDRAEQMGIKVKKKWMATLDDRTRVEHRHLDGQVRENDEPFETDGYEIMYPGDPDAEPEMIYNCRCTLVAEIEGIDYHDERNDSKLGDMTYEEWKHAKDKPGTEVAEPVKEEQPKAAEQTQEEKAEPTFKEVNNKEEAKEELGKIFASVENNFMKNDERLIVENTNQLLKLNARFGAISENNGGFITASPSGRAIGYAGSRFIPDPNGNLDENTRLGLVGRYYKNYDTIIEEERKSQKSFFSMPALEENWSIYTVTHEYGHILENYILVQRTNYDELKDTVAAMVRPSAQQSRDVYKKAEKKGAKDIYDEIVAIAKEKNPDFSLKDNLSEYGHTNHFEAFAEIFANSQLGEPNELGLAMQEWLEKEGF